MRYSARGAIAASALAASYLRFSVRSRVGRQFCGGHWYGHFRSQWHLGARLPPLLVKGGGYWFYQEECGRMLLRH
jgi:hypothetical protein